MANNAAGLNSKLATQLRDTAYATWTTGEMDELIARAVDSLFPRFSRPLDPTTAYVTVVADTYYYDLPSGTRLVERVDRWDSAGNDYGPVSGRSWEIVDDVMLNTGQIHIGPIADAGDTLHLHGSGKYDVTTNLIPDDLVALVTAKARNEAYRRLLADREKFKTWLVRNQNQNISINEMLQMINEADVEAARLTREAPRTWKKPVSGRVG